MAVTGVIQKLNARMECEFHTSHLYMQLSRWSAGQGLNGLASVLRDQAQESITRMMRLFNYMKRVGANPVIGTDAPAPVCCDSPEQLFEKIYAQFQRCDDELTRLSQACWTARDFTTLAFTTQLMGQQQRDKARLESIRQEIFHALARDLNLRHAGLN